jgi:general secretion pathway protein C
MSKGLIIRQVFVLVDLALLILVVFVAYKVLQRVFEPPSMQTATPYSDPAARAQIQVARVGELTEYSDIVRSGIFGDAARQSRKAQDQPVEQSGEPDDTDFPLRLLATVTAGPQDLLATAIIENQMPGKKRAETYYIDEPIIDGQVELKEVHVRMVVLYNLIEKRDEILEMELEGPTVRTAANTSAARPTAAAISRPSRQREEKRLKRAEVFRELQTDPSAIIAEVRPQLYRDKQGKITGVTAKNISNHPLAKQLGLQDGDVVQKVNGIQIDSVQRISEIVTKFQNLNTFYVEILRDGQKRTITYRLE